MSLEVIGAGFGRTGTMSRYACLFLYVAQPAHKEDPQSHPTASRLYLRTSLDESKGYNITLT
jgi:hypothetical protein